MAASGVSPLSYAESARSLAPVSNSAISAACCIAWPIGALRPLGGAGSAVRAWPEPVVGEPAWGPVGFGGGNGVVGCGDSVQAPRRNAMVASARRGRIGGRTPGGEFHMDGDEHSQATGRQAEGKPPDRPLPAGLHIVATPIGNLRDISLRALDTLRAVDLIAAEDTRVFAKLASHHGIAVPTVSYSDATQDAAEPRLLRALAEGKRVALVSDAGMPLISDPGYRLVRAAVGAGHTVTAAPGASSLPTALALAGLPTE